MKTLLVVTDPLRLSPETATKSIDTAPGVVDWMRFFENSFCVVASVDATALTNQLSRRLPGHQFFVSEIDPARKNGMLPPQVWTFINKATARSLDDG